MRYNAYKEDLYVNANSDVQQKLQSNRAPYPRPNPVLTIIRRFRDKGLRVPITPSSLELIGLNYNSASQALQAIRFLELIDKDGNPTEPFEKMKRVSDDE